MKAKFKDREKAIGLRASGKSVNCIADILGVSKSSVSVWVRGVELTEEQKIRLGSNSLPNLSIGHLAVAGKYRDKRKEWRDIGRKMYLDGDKRYAFACALFLGEGAKGRNALDLSNTDERLLIFWLSFIRDCFGVKNDDVAVVVTCYLNNGLSLEEIQNHWLDVLSLPPSSLRKTVVKSKYYSGSTSGKHPFGVCNIRVNRTDIVQKLFGSINEAMGSGATNLGD